MEAGVRELRDHLSQYLAAVSGGAEVTVTDHGKAVARLIGLDAPSTFDRLVTEGVISPAARPKRDRDIPTISPDGTVSDLVSDQRR
ncbi:hypothetical protein BH23ACT6_BH23ACT6_09610 [soil metagenome]